MNLRRLAVLLLIVALAVPFSAGFRPLEEKVLVIGHAESTDSLDPARGYTQTTGFVNHVTYETLVTFPDEDASEIIPQLATEWSVSEDGLTYTFKLLEDVVFSSGNPLTADDVVFSFNRLKNIKGNPAFLADSIASVEAVDTYTVAITLHQVDPSFLANLPNNNAFNVADSKLIKENGGLTPKTRPRSTGRSVPEPDVGGHRPVYAREMGAAGRDRAGPQSQLARGTALFRPDHRHQYRRAGHPEDRAGSWGYRSRARSDQRSDRRIGEQSGNSDCPQRGAHPSLPADEPQSGHRRPCVRPAGRAGDPLRARL